MSHNGGHRRKAARNITQQAYERAVDMRPLTEPCPECGKFRYVNRKAAKAARKRTNRSDSMSIYLCGDYWHIGHTPYVIRKGYQQRSNTYNTYGSVRLEEKAS